VTFYNALLPISSMAIPSNKINWTNTINGTQATAYSAFNRSLIWMNPVGSYAYMINVTFTSGECPDGRCILDQTGGGSFIAGQSEDDFTIQLNTLTSIIFSKNYTQSGYSYDLDSGKGTIMHTWSDIQSNFAWLELCSTSQQFTLSTIITKRKVSYRLSCTGRNQP